jgi:Na+/H+ antiporter NhaC
MKTESFRTKIIRSLIISFVIGTLLLALMLTASLDPPQYRLKERIKALMAYTENPSASTKAAWDNEEARVQYHEMINWVIFAFLPILLVDAAVIYFFWNHGKRERIAKASAKYG